MGIENRETQHLFEIGNYSVLDHHTIDEGNSITFSFLLQGEYEPIPQLLNFYDILEKIGGFEALKNKGWSDDERQMLVPMNLKRTCEKEGADTYKVDITWVRTEHAPETLEAFKTDIDDAVEFAREFGASTPMQNLPSFELLAGNETGMVYTLLQKFRVTPQSDKPTKGYRISDSPSGEEIGGIEVRVFATNEEDVFLGEYRDSNGDVDWVIRPLEGEE